MPSPDACEIRIKCKEGQRDEVKRLATLHGKTITRYALDRLLLPWTDRDLVDLGFGLVLKAMRDKGYPDHYIKDIVGDLIGEILDGEDYSPEYQEMVEEYQSKAKHEEYLRKKHSGELEERYGR